MNAFTDRLGGVWTEAYRVLKSDGILVFTYHHSRREGWRSILAALVVAGFNITAAHPIKSEMSVAMPKFLAKEPINFDVIFVCRKKSRMQAQNTHENLWNSVEIVSAQQIERLRAKSFSLSKNDIRVVVMGQVLRRLAMYDTVAHCLKLLESNESNIETLINKLDSAA